MMGGALFCAGARSPWAEPQDWHPVKHAGFRDHTGTRLSVRFWLYKGDLFGNNQRGLGRLKSAAGQSDVVNKPRQTLGLKGSAIPQLGARTSHVLEIGLLHLGGAR